MLEKLLGSITADKVLMFMYVYDEGYPTEIAKTFSFSLSMIQKQLFKFEDGGIMVSRLRGKIRIFTWNPRYPFLKELKNLLAKTYEYLPEEIIEKYYRKRTRPRRKDKKL